MRSFAAVLLGFMVNMVVMFVLLAGAWMVLGPGGSLRPGTWETTDTWTILMTVARMAAAVCGTAFACGFTSSQKPGYWTAGLILLLGLAEAFSSMNVAPVDTPRPQTVEMFEAMNNAHSPTWATFVWSLLAGASAFVTAARFRQRPT